MKLSVIKETPSAMKKAIKILAVFSLLAILLMVTSCSHRTCSGMKYYNQDKKRGLAH
jgi:hypothetical protein